MKKSISAFLVLFIFASCASTNRIIEINDSKSDFTGFKLTQNPKAHSAEKNKNTLVNQYFNIQTTCLFQERNSQNPLVSLEFQMQKPVHSVQTDSVMYLKLDNENIRIVSGHTVSVVPEKSRTPPNSMKSNELLMHQYPIPENLWLSVTNSKTIIYKLSSGKYGIEVKPNPEETAKLKEFFSRAMQRRLEIIPMVPPGKVKW